MTSEEHTDGIGLVIGLASEACEIVRSEWQKRSILGKLIFPMWLVEGAVWWSFVISILVLTFVHDRYQDRPNTEGFQIYVDEEDGD